MHFIKKSLISVRTWVVTRIILKDVYTYLLSTCIHKINGLCVMIKCVFMLWLSVWCLSALHKWISVVRLCFIVHYSLVLCIGYLLQIKPAHLLLFEVMCWIYVNKWALLEMKSLLDTWKQNCKTLSLSLSIGLCISSVKI